MDRIEYPDFMKGERTPLVGLPSASEALALVSKRFPEKPYCLVKDWAIFRVQLTPDELSRIHSIGQIPMVMFSYRVIEDSHGRFDLGDWVRSSMCIGFHDGVMFETRNTVYVLIGPGHEQPASPKDILSLY